MVSWRQGQWESSMCGWAGLTAAPRCDGACSFVPYKNRVMLRQKGQLFQNLNLPGKNEKVYTPFPKSNGHKLQQEKVTVEGGKLPCWEPLDGEWITWGSVRPLLLQVETQPSPVPLRRDHTQLRLLATGNGLKEQWDFPPPSIPRLISITLSTKQTSICHTEMQRVRQTLQDHNLFSLIKDFLVLRNPIHSDSPALAASSQRCVTALLNSFLVLPLAITAALGSAADCIPFSWYFKT